MAVLSLRVGLIIVCSSKLELLSVIRFSTALQKGTRGLADVVFQHESWAQLSVIFRKGSHCATGSLS